MNLKRILFSVSCMVALCASATSIQEVGGWLESGWVTFTLDSSAFSYNVYCKASGGDYTLLDSPLVRNYGTYGRADALGLSAGTYQFKVVPVDASGNEMSGSAESSTFTVTAKDRTGFAFVNGYVPGAYKSDGTLKSGAVVIYVTNNNKDAVTLDVTTSNKGSVTTEVGFQNILDGFKKGCDSRPLCIRLIGQITTPSYNDKGDIVIDLNKKEVCPGVTIEGVGNDATCDGWGIRLKNTTSAEICNLGFMNTASDEGDDVGLQQTNNYIWVHNCDFFYGKAGGDADQAKGDGSLDCKKSNYVTISYNHFWDNGKCCLLGLSEKSYDYYITYHHNWFDHSDSRHPRVRYYSAHVYNNYYDGCAKYGVGSTMGSSIFVDRNYFRNTNKPMLISMQGTDASGSGTFSSEDGGIIKAYGNTFAEKSSNFKLVYWASNNTSFDAYEVSNATDQVPSSVVAKQGGTSYSNFDTNSSIMYSYTADDPSTIPDKLAGDLGAGRCQHGDFQWTFTNSSDDSSYAVNTALQSALTSYTTSLVGLFVDDDYTSNNGTTDDSSSNSGSSSGGSSSDSTNSGSSSGSNVTVSTGYECYFTGGAPSSTFYTVSGNYSSSKGSATVNGTTYTTCLKMESSTSVTFTTTEEMTLTLVFESGSTADVKIDGTTVSAASGSNVITVDLLAGSHTITKASTHYLYYINLSGGSDNSGSTGGDDNSSSGGDDNSNSGSSSSNSGVESYGDYVCVFTGGTPSSSFYTINGNYTTNGGHGQATVNGTTYYDCLKMESSTSITFTITEEMILTLVFEEGASKTPNIKIDGEKSTAAEGGNVISVTLEAGTHTITKADSHYLFYMDLEATDVDDEEEDDDESFKDVVENGFDDSDVTAVTGECYFTGEFEESGENHDIFNITLGDNSVDKGQGYSSSHGSVVYNGMTLDYCLKMETGAQITFDVAESWTTLTVILGVDDDDTNHDFKLDGTKVYADLSSDGTYYIYTATLDAGSHIIEKDKTAFLFYISLSTGAGINNITFEATGNDKLYNLNGQRVSNQYNGVVILNGKKLIVK
ncbi:MAG: hypothetical protein LUC88_03930 [Prevotella sp.]|nr:hypothetical protein [Prevotella sp.]